MGIIRATALLAMSVIITAAIVAGLFIDAITTPTLSASPPSECAHTTQPVLHTLEFVDVC